MANEEKIGKVTHYFGKINVAVLKIHKGIKLGENLHFAGKHTDFSQEIKSLQIEHEDVAEAAAGADVAMKVKDRVRPGDTVFRLAE
jgi:translation elongation factor EF-1alpha